MQTQTCIYATLPCLYSMAYTIISIFPTSFTGPETDYDYGKGFLQESHYSIVVLILIVVNKELTDLKNHA